MPKFYCRPLGSKEKSFSLSAEASAKRKNHFSYLPSPRQANEKISEKESRCGKWNEENSLPQRPLFGGMLNKRGFGIAW